jgi:hypothetical protein
VIVVPKVSHFSWGFILDQFLLQDFLETFGSDKAETQTSGVLSMKKAGWSKELPPGSKGEETIGYHGTCVCDAKNEKVDGCHHRSWR